MYFLLKIKMLMHLFCAAANHALSSTKVELASLDEELPSSTEIPSSTRSREMSGPSPRKNLIEDPDSSRSR
jgi:hypothetical protein